MKKDKILKKGGIDTILAYVVVSIPLFYVLIFMISTLYHFSVQMHINQTLKETLIMASSYGQLTDGMLEYLFENLTNIGDENTTWLMRIGLRKLDANGDVVNWNNVVGGSAYKAGYGGINYYNLLKKDNNVAKDVIVRKSGVMFNPKLVKITNVNPDA